MKKFLEGMGNGGVGNEKVFGETRVLWTICKIRPVQLEPYPTLTFHTGDKINTNMNTSALETFDQCCFSEWYTATMQRVLFPCKSKGEIDEWRERVCRLFCRDTSAVSDQGRGHVRHLTQELPLGNAGSLVLPVPRRYRNRS